RARRRGRAKGAGHRSCAAFSHLPRRANRRRNGSIASFERHPERPGPAARLASRTGARRDGAPRVALTPTGRSKEASRMQPAPVLVPVTTPAPPPLVLVAPAAPAPSLPAIVT